MENKKNSNGKRRHAPPVPPLQNRLDAIERLVKYMIAGIWNFYSISIARYGETSLIAVRNDNPREQTGQESRRISYAGLSGSEMVFISTSEVPERASKEGLRERLFPNTASKEWLREQLREHFVATSESVLIFVPVWLLDFLTADDFPKHWRETLLRYWKNSKVWQSEATWHREHREFNSLTGFVTGNARSGEYVDDYILSLKTITAAAAVVRTGMSPPDICALVRKGQMLSAEIQDGYTGDGIFDGRHACRYLDLTSKELDEAFERFPEIFKVLGWERKSYPDKYEE